MGKMYNSFVDLAEQPVLLVKVKMFHLHTVSLVSNHVNNFSSAGN